MSKVPLVAREAAAAEYDLLDQTMLNYEDTEEQLPQFEDVESGPLCRETVKERAHLDLNKSFENNNKENTDDFYAARKSCPEDQRQMM